MICAVLLGDYCVARPCPRPRRITILLRYEQGMVPCIRPELRTQIGMKYDYGNEENA